MKFQCQSSNDNGHAHIHCFLFGSWQWSHFLFSLTKLFLESWNARQSASALWVRLAKTLHENISYIYLSISGHQPCASKDWFCSGLFSIAFSKTYVGNDTHFLFSSTKLFLEGWDSRQLAPLGKVDQKLFYLWKVLLCVTFYWLLDYRQSSGSHTSIVSFLEVGNDPIFFSVWRNCS